MAGPDCPEFTDETIRLWFKTYLEACYELQNKDKALITQQELEALYTEHKIVSIVSENILLGNTLLI